MKNFFTRTLFVLSAFIMLFACTQSNEQKGDPKVTVSPMSIDASAGDFELNYTGENLNGKTLAVESSEDWLTAAVENEKIKFHVDANFGDARMAKITILIDGNAVAEATISQKTYESDYFNVSVDKITSYGCTAKISTKGTYKGNYYFIILGKSTVDNFLSLETGNYGDVNFLDALYQNEYSWLQGYAKENGYDVPGLLAAARSFYQVNGQEVEMPYSTLMYNTEYYLVVMGMDLEGKRTTPIVLKAFSTKDIEKVDLKFTATVSNVKEHSAEIVVKPSNNTDTYYWTYLSEIDYNKVDNDPRNVMTNMIKNIKSAATQTGKPISSFLHTGNSQENLADVWANTKYTIVAWGMDAQGSATTDPVNVETFTTKEEPVVDDCTFTINVVETKEMDLKIKVVPSNPATRYYIAPVLKSYTEGYNDDQFAQRVINMQNQQWEGTSYNWANNNDLFSGQVSKWGRKDLGWTFQAAHDYVIYVFGMAADGTRTTKVAKIEARTSDPKPSNMTFTINKGKPNWHYVTCEVIPSNNEEGWLSFFIETSEIDNNGLRKADGTLEDAAIMTQIEEYYGEMGENINYAVRYGRKEYKATAYKSGVKYSLLLCAFNGTNTTRFTEVQFDVPEMPFEKGKAEITTKLTVFNAAELAKLDPAMFKDYKDENRCIILMESTPNEAAREGNWYMGFWPSYTTYAKEGGLDYIVRLMSTINDGYSNSVKHTEQMWSPDFTAWYGPAGNNNEVEWTDPIEGKTYKHVPMFFYAFAEDTDGNFGKMHIQYFRPVPTEADKKEDFDIVASKPYKFWNDDTKSVQQVYVMSADGKDIQRIQLH